MNKRLIIAMAALSLLGRAGLAIQRTKAYKSDLEIQRGFLVGVTYKRVDLTTHVFNLGWTDPMVVLAMGFAF